MYLMVTVFVHCYWLGVKVKTLRTGNLKLYVLILGRGTPNVYLL